LALQAEETRKAEEEKRLAALALEEAEDKAAAEAAALEEQEAAEAAARAKARAAANSKSRAAEASVAAEPVTTAPNFPLCLRQYVPAQCVRLLLEYLQHRLK